MAAVEVSVSDPQPDGAFNATFIINAYTTNRSTAFTKVYHGAVGLDAEAIVERPSHFDSGVLHHLARFNAFNIQSRYGEGNNCTGDYPTSQATRYDMYNGSTLLATARYASTSPTGCSWTAKWYHYS
ncbi:MAG: hypothetical protein ACR2F6_15140 [Mycobacteriales bacterium]